MHVTETLNEGLRREYKISVPASELEQAVTQKLNALAHKVKIPGFRPGKAPLQLLRARYGDSVQGEAMEEAVKTSSKSTLQQHNLKPALQPKISITDYTPGQQLEYTMAVEVLPEIPALDLPFLAVETVSLEVTDAKVQEAIDRITRENRSFAEPEKPRPAASGDQLTLDFLGKLNGVPFDGGKAEGYTVEIGGGRLIPGFEDQLIGFKVGETRDIHVTFPENYGSAELAGKDATFTITVHKIEAPVEKPLDDARAVELGYDNLAGMRQRVRESLEREFTQLARPYNKRKLLDALDAAIAFDLPPTLVKSELHTIWHQVHDADGSHAHDHSHDEHILPEKDHAELKPIAERRVKLGLVLADIGTKNNVTVADEEVRRAIWQEAFRYPNPREVLEFFQKNPQAIASVRAPLYEDKVADHILSQVKVTNRVLSEDEFNALMKQAEEEDALPQPQAETGTAQEPAATEGSGSAAKPKKAKKADKGEEAKADAAETAETAEKPKKPKKAKAE